MSLHTRAISFDRKQAEIFIRNVEKIQKPSIEQAKNIIGKVETTERPTSKSSEKDTKITRKFWSPTPMLKKNL